MLTPLLCVLASSVITDSWVLVFTDTRLLIPSPQTLSPMVPSIRCILTLPFLVHTPRKGYANESRADSAGGLAQWRPITLRLLPYLSCWKASFTLLQPLGPAMFEKYSKQRLLGFSDESIQNILLNSLWILIHYRPTRNVLTSVSQSTICLRQSPSRHHF